MSDDGLSERQRAAKIRHELNEQALQLEAERAKVLIDEFLVSVKAAGLAPQPLKATTLDGHVVKTDKVGWYVNAKKSVAIGESGQWYVLTVPSSTWGWLRGVKLQPSLPELVVGRGGRDGESGDLTDFLQRMLERGAGT